MLLGLLARYQHVKLAHTAAEREAIYRFRYSIYAKELRRDYPGMDHERGTLSTPDDEAPETRLFYTGSVEAGLTGTCRARLWDAPPPEVVEEYSLERVPRGMRVAVLERMMVRATLRGRALLPSFLWHGYAQLMSEGVDLCVLTCVPGLARHYVRLGARPYGARLVEGAASVALPVMIVMNDPRHLRAVGSFMLPQMRRLARPFDVTPLLPLFAPEAQAIQLTVEAAELARLPAFEGLRARAQRRVAQSAFVLRVQPGELIVREGTADRELYFVLGGELEASVSGVAVARVGAGEPFGEMAFFGSAGVRTATVRAVTASRLLVLRRKFLDELAAVDAHAALHVARWLARFAADRFASARLKDGPPRETRAP